jgi:hypothetical protein
MIDQDKLKYAVNSFLIVFDNFLDDDERVAFLTFGQTI